MMISPEEHLSNDLIPELLVDDKGKLRTDVNLRVVDIKLLIQHIANQIGKAIISYKEHFFNSFYEEIISIEIFDASTFLYCHLFDCNEMIDGKPPLFLYSLYYEDRNELSVYFTGYPPTTRLQSIEIEKDVLMQISDNGKLVALLIRNAEDRIAREISKEDREKLREEFKLRASSLKSLRLESNKSNSSVKKSYTNCCTIL
ncbi:hypothetical protein RhiirC2_769847 [Rhizophagus irregularis]|uniref:Uncharacterized protein n=1 Tax=Rhizophagus irregularis TaxID=588596 RepID=A0A2N1NY28_9GLOM|nr:hypothetical protein RhiirC2_769847 [Rhizophagus irregularis]